MSVSKVVSKWNGGGLSAVTYFRLGIFSINFDSHHLYSTSIPLFTCIIVDSVDSISRDERDAP